MLPLKWRLKCLCWKKRSLLTAVRSAGKRNLLKKGTLAQRDEDRDVGKPSVAPSFFGHSSAFLPRLPAFPEIDLNVSLLKSHTRPAPSLCLRFLLLTHPFL